MGRREYDFGDGGKMAISARSVEHREMFEALQTLGAMGARIAPFSAMPTRPAHGA